MTPSEAEKIARYLFLHKWLASPYTPGNELLLVRAIEIAAAGELLEQPDREDPQR